VYFEGLPEQAEKEKAKGATEMTYKFEDAKLAHFLQDGFSDEI
jgi:hypothetical protein